MAKIQTENTIVDSRKSSRVHKRRRKEELLNTKDLSEEQKSRQSSVTNQKSGKKTKHKVKNSIQQTKKQLTKKNKSSSTKIRKGRPPKILKITEKPKKMTKTKLKLLEKVQKRIVQTLENNQIVLIQKLTEQADFLKVNNFPQDKNYFEGLTKLAQKSQDSFLKLKQKVEKFLAVPDINSNEEISRKKRIKKHKNSIKPTKVPRKKLPKNYVKNKVKEIDEKFQKKTKKLGRPRKIKNRIKIQSDIQKQDSENTDDDKAIVQQIDSDNEKTFEKQDDSINQTKQIKKTKQQALMTETIDVEDEEKDQENQLDDLKKSKKVTTIEIEEIEKQNDVQKKNHNK